MSVEVLNRCRGIIRNFLWGGSDEQRKVVWVKWDVVCKPKEHGGLGVKEWGMFNKALLGKWRWRLLQDRESLCCRFLRAKYSMPWEPGGRFVQLGSASPWWKDVVSMCWSEGESGWFDSNLAHSIEIGPAGGLLEVWRWLPVEGGLYNVKSAYSVLRGERPEDCMEEFQALWMVPSPSNVKAFVWRLFWDRIQTRVNLSRRRMIPVAGVHCPFCSDGEENSVHLLLSCLLVEPVWGRVFDWLGLVSYQVQGCVDHFLNFAASGRTVEQRRCLRSVWCAVVWELWLQRNGLVFRGETPDWERFLDKVQRQTWKWLSVNVVGFKYFMSQWIISPVQCLGSLS